MVKFGMVPASGEGNLSKEELEEKRKARAIRFGGTTKEEEEEKRRKRLERFGGPTLDE